MLPKNYFSFLTCNGAKLERRTFLRKNLIFITSFSLVFWPSGKTRETSQDSEILVKLLPLVRHNHLPAYVPTIKTKRLSQLYSHNWVTVCVCVHVHTCTSFVPLFYIELCLLLRDFTCFINLYLNPAFHSFSFPSYGWFFFFLNMQPDWKQRNHVYSGSWLIILFKLYNMVYDNCFGFWFLET